MFNLKHAALLGGVAMAVSAPAFAQDDTGGRFNGIYVGVSGGYDVQPNDVGERILFDRNLDGNFNDTVVTAAGANAFSPGFCNGRATSAAPTACRNDRDGWNYNSRIGADVQYGKIVVGAVGEFGRSEIRDSVSAFSTTPANYVMRRRVEWEANARGRLGYVAGDSTLFYGTAGVGYARIDHDFYSSNTLNAYELRGDKNKWGFIGGGGIEQQLGDSGFSVGLEYTYHQYNDDETRVRVTRGAQPATNPFVLAPNTTGTDFARSDERFKWHSLRATAAFRF